MIHAINWANSHLHGDALYQSHRLRHSIFVERTAYDVPTFDGTEYDQFDTPAATYLIHSDGAGTVNGVARLVPTTRPYMLRDLWPELVDGPLPNSDDVWEGTRFGVDSRLPPNVRQAISRKLVAGCQEFGLAHGLKAMIVLMPPLILRSVIKRAGCDLQPLGSVMRRGGIPVQAAMVPISETALFAVRRSAGITGKVLVADLGLRVA